MLARSATGRTVRTRPTESGQLDPIANARYDVIPLTRLRHGETFFLNPDLFERLDTHVDTTIRLTDGTEYIVVEPGDEIVRRIAEFRARVLAMAAVLQSSAFANASWERPPDDGDPPPDDEMSRELHSGWAANGSERERP